MTVQATALRRRRGRSRDGSPAALRAAAWLRGYVAGDPPALGALDDDLLSLLRAARLDLLAYETGATSAQRARRVMEAEYRARRLAAAACEAIALTKSLGVPAVVLKGTGLARRYWGDPMLRESSDVDLLVREADVPKVRAALEARGYATGEEWVPVWYERRWFYHESLRPPERTKPPVEIHWDFLRSGLAASDVGALIEAAEPVEVYGASLPTPPTSWQLVTNAAHCVHEVFRVRQLLDIALIARVAQPSDWAAAIEIARRARVATMLYYAVVVSAERLGWDPPRFVLDLRPPRVRDRIARRHVAALPLFGTPSRTLLQLHHLANPVLSCDGAGCVTRIPYSLLTDRGSLAADVERLRRRFVASR